MGGGPFFKVWDIDYEEISQDTPYGAMSDVICKGVVGPHEVFTLQRHGATYQLEPPNIPWKANAYGMFMQELDFIIHVTACGSLRTDDTSGSIVLFDQIIDWTKQRPLTLGAPIFNRATYLDFSRPISRKLIRIAHDILAAAKISHIVLGTMLSEEGPRFSTVAESKMYRFLGADFVNQTSCPEVYFCRELKMPVLAMAMITNKIDFDGFILADDISSSIVKYKEVTPRAIRTFIENLDQIEIDDKMDTTPYDISKFDLRVAVDGK